MDLVGTRSGGWQDGRIDVRFMSDGSNCCPDPTSNDGIYCGPNCPYCPPLSPGCSTPDFPYWGVGVAGYEYRRYQAGASPAWTPLRFPGQYYDAETDLFENWNRYYDPSTGRYLQPEQLMQAPRQLVALAKKGMMPQAYAYALNNPLRYVDPDGLAARCPGGFWVGAPLVLGEISLGSFGGLGFGGVYSCTSAPITVVTVSVCGFAAVPPGPWKKAHVGCGVGAGIANDVQSVDDFKGWSWGAFGTIGPATVFIEGQSPLKPDSFGGLIGPGTGWSAGPLGCKTLAWEL
jgi:RHS repeat-associated protein